MYHLAVHEALSGVFGSISLAAWIFLLIPQLVENYRQGSADGISLLFLAVWFVGDITNLTGALLSGLVPTVIALAIYFCIADTILIVQCVYYNAINARRSRKISQLSTASEDSVEQPLLSRQNTNGASRHGSRRRESLGLPGSHRRSSARTDSLRPLLVESSGTAAWVKNTSAVFLVCLAGTVGWFIAWKSGVWHPTPEHAGPIGGQELQLGGQILGYISAVAYLGARIPQIIKNQQEHSCEGLSLLFFLLSLLGNFTYGAGILFHSLEREYIITNLPWLIGSLGTMAEDAIIFIQFRVFTETSSDFAVA